MGIYRDARGSAGSRSTSRHSRGWRDPSSASGLRSSRKRSAGSISRFAPPPTGTQTVLGSSGNCCALGRPAAQLLQMMLTMSQGGDTRRADARINVLEGRVTQLDRRVYRLFRTIKQLTTAEMQGSALLLRTRRMRATAHGALNSGDPIAR